MARMPVGSQYRPEVAWSGTSRGVALADNGEFGFLVDVFFSVGVTAHREGRLLRPTLKSVSDALLVLVERGYPCELVIVLDNASQPTVDEAMFWANRNDLGFHTKVVQANVGESGAARNRAVAEASGEFMALVDGDDLVLANYFANSVDMLVTEGDNVVAHPQFVVSFGDRASLWRVQSQREEGFDYRKLLDGNPWPSSAVARRRVFIDHPFVELGPSSGFGPEDYAWQVRSVLEDVVHVTAPGTAFFYRTRNKGGVNNSHAASIPPAFDLSELRAKLPIQVLESPNAVRSDRRGLLRSAGIGISKVATRLRLRMLVGRVVRMILPEPQRLRARALVVSSMKRALGIKPNPQTQQVRAIARQLIGTGLLKQLSHIEPAITPALWHLDKLPLWEPQMGEFARVLDETLEALHGTENLILAPWLGVGGADLVTRNYAQAFSSIEDRSGSVSILTTYLPERTIKSLIPEGVRHHQLSEAYRTWPVDLQRRFIATLLTMLRANVVLSINCFDLTTAMREYGLQIGKSSKVYVSLFAWDLVGEEGYPTNPITDDPQRSFLDHISGIITDNSVTQAKIVDTLGVPPELVKVHRQHGGLEAQEFETVASVASAYFTTGFDSARPFKVLWPHRVDKEKRPDIVAEIASRLRASNSPVEIHVYGQRVLHQDGVDPVKAMVAAGVRYHGPYSGGLQSLDTSDFNAVLLTSESEGLPLVLVQAMLLGLPVIASNVGGVGDIVQDEHTGLLVSTAGDVDGYVDAIHRLAASQELRQRLIFNGYEIARKHHTPLAFARTVAQEFLSL